MHVENKPPRITAAAIVVAALLLFIIVAVVAAAPLSVEPGGGVDGARLGAGVAVGESVDPATQEPSSKILHGFITETAPLRSVPTTSVANSFS